MIYLYQFWTLFKPFFEIVFVAVVIYYSYFLIQGTKTVQLMQGFAALFLLFFISQKMNLMVLNWLLGKVFTFSIIAFLIIFQPELRRALVQIGRRPFFSRLPKEDRLTDILMKALALLSEKRLGALIALEREIGLKNYVHTGIKLDAKISEQLLVTLFFQNTPLHDGGVIIRQGQVSAAGCVFPLSSSTTLDPLFGTRHRAALGLSEETDALVFVVSEETGGIAAALDGKLMLHLDTDRVRRILNNMFPPGAGRKIASMGV